MSTRLCLSVFKGCSEQQLRKAIEARVQEVGGDVLWDSDVLEGVQMSILSTGDVHIVDVNWSGTYGVLKGIARILQCPWMEARIQEGSHWDYSLMRGEEDLDEFSTFPEYWLRDEEEIRRYRGNPDVLADAWGVSRERVERYLVQWGPARMVVKEGPFPNMNTVHVDPETGEATRIKGVLAHEFSAKGKAYPGDEHEYGDIWQLRDFLRALGTADPDTRDYRHRLLIPDWSDGELESRKNPPKRKSLWEHIKWWFT